jgi:hypothetical protein
VVKVRVDLLGASGSSCPHPDFCSVAHWDVLLTGGGAAASLASAECGQTCRQALEISVSVTSDSPFEIRLRLYADASVTWSGVEGAIEAKLGFPDLPVGATIRSCKGFLADVTTRVTRTSWGSVKAIYR